VADEARQVELERQVHESVIDRFESLEKGQEGHAKQLTEMGATLAVISTNTSWMPALHKRVRALENQRNYVVGGSFVAGVLWKMAPWLATFFYGHGPGK